MTTLVAVDPGMATGVFVGKYSDTEPLLRTGFIQIPGGIEGFDEWWCANEGSFGRQYALVCEKFVPMPVARAWKLEELEPIRIEGYLFARHNAVVWQRSGAMVLRDGPGWTTSQRKRASDDLLRRNGWWLTKNDTGLGDANDANAAAKHALAYMRSIGHMPTIETHLRPAVDLNDLTTEGNR